MTRYSLSDDCCGSFRPVADLREHDMGRIVKVASRLGRQDSNLGSWIQSPLPYRLATPEWFTPNISEFVRSQSLKLVLKSTSLVTRSTVQTPSSRLGDLHTCARGLGALYHSEHAPCIDWLPHSATGDAYDETGLGWLRLPLKPATRHRLKCGRATNGASVRAYHVRHITPHHNSSALPQPRWLKRHPEKLWRNPQTIRPNPAANRWETSVIFAMPYLRIRCRTMPS